MAAREFASVGRVRRAHGIRGELVIELLTDAPEAHLAPGRRVFAGTRDGALWRDPDTGADLPCTVAAARPFKEGLLVTLDGLSDRTEAERWRGRHLLVPFAELSPPEEGEVFLHELAGMRVVDPLGAELGVVSSWNQLPNGILLDVQGPRGTVQVPFNEAFVRAVDRAGKTLTAVVPEELWEVLRSAQDDDSGSAQDDGGGSAQDDGGGSAQDDGSGSARDDSDSRPERSEGPRC